MFEYDEMWEKWGKEGCSMECLKTRIYSIKLVRRILRANFGFYVLPLALAICLNGCYHNERPSTDPFPPNKFFSMEEALKSPLKVDILSLEGIDSLSPEIGKLKNLVILSIYDSDIRFMPDGLDSLKKLLMIIIRKCEMNHIPPQVAKLPLGALHINNTNIIEIPDDFALLEHVDDLDLSNNSLDVFEKKGENALRYLQRLVLDSNRIHELNLKRSDVPELMLLSLRGNKLSDSAKIELQKEFHGISLRL